MEQQHKGIVVSGRDVARDTAQAVVELASSSPRRVWKTIENNSSFLVQESFSLYPPPPPFSSAIGSYYGEIAFKCEFTVESYQNDLFEGLLMNDNGILLDPFVKEVETIERYDILNRIIAVKYDNKLFVGTRTLFHNIHFDPATRTIVIAWRETQHEKMEIQGLKYKNAVSPTGFVVRLHPVHSGWSILTFVQSFEGDSSYLAGIRLVAGFRWRKIADSICQASRTAHQLAPTREVEIWRMEMCLRSCILYYLNDWSQVLKETGIEAFVHNSGPNKGLATKLTVSYRGEYILGVPPITAAQFFRDRHDIWDSMAERTEILEVFDEKSMAILKEIAPSLKFMGNYHAVLLWVTQMTTEGIFMTLLRSSQHQKAISFIHGSLPIEMLPSGSIITPYGENSSYVQWLFSLRFDFPAPIDVMNVVKGFFSSLKSSKKVIFQHFEELKKRGKIAIPMFQAVEDLETTPLAPHSTRFQRTSENTIYIKEHVHLYFQQSQQKRQRLQEPINNSDNIQQQNEQANSISISNCLLDLPENILVKIFCGLPLSSIRNISLVCHKFYKITQSKFLWKAYYQDHFPDIAHSSSTPVSSSENSSPSSPLTTATTTRNFLKEVQTQLSLSYTWEHNNPKVEILHHAHSSSVLEVLNTNDGRVFSGSKDRKIKVWNPPTNDNSGKNSNGSYNCVGTFSGPQAPVVGIDVVGDELFSGFANGAMRSWSISKGNLISQQQFVLKSDGVLFLHPRLVIWDENIIQIWDEKTSRQIALLSSHSKKVTCTKTLGSMLVSCSFDKTVKIWDTATGRDVISICGHTAGVNAIDVFNQTFIASSSNDRCVKIWDIRNVSEALYCLNGHESSVKCVKYAARRLLSGSEDRTILVWDFSTNGNSPHQLRKIDKISSSIISIDADCCKICCGLGDGSILIHDFSKT